tara:strand:+ start:731 stop:1045 length:315 start_codon:yes stop_codon:yes gene_type:complete
MTSFSKGNPFELVSLRQIIKEETDAKIDSTILSRLGRVIAPLFRDTFQKEPPTEKEEVNGGVRTTKHYPRYWIRPLIKLWRTVDPDFFIQIKSEYNQLELLLFI